MSDLLNLVYQVSGRNRSKIDKLIAPLEIAFGINAHAYYRIDTKGGLTYLSNLPEIAEFYFSNQLYKGNPFLKHPDVVQPGFVLAKASQVPDFIRSQARVEQKYQLNNHLLLFEREGDILHAHGFATTHNDPRVVNVYLNNLGRLQAYCHYFREETAELQKKLDHIKVDFTKYIGQEFFKNGLMKEKGIHERAQREFFFKLYESKGGVKPLKPLSKREMECLERMLDGKSAAIIAKDLSLKTRTVEFYIEGIKNKLCCSSKYEIFEFVNSLKALGGDIALLQYSWQ